MLLWRYSESVDVTQFPFYANTQKPDYLKVNLFSNVERKGKYLSEFLYTKQLIFVYYTNIYKKNEDHIADV